MKLPSREINYTLTMDQFHIGLLYMLERRARKIKYPEPIKLISPSWLKKHTLAVRKFLLTIELAHKSSGKGNLVFGPPQKG